MKEYHKIDTVFKRDPATKHKSLLIGDYSQEAFAYLAKNTWIFTEKVDGTNIRVMIGSDRKISFGGKTDNAQIPARLVSRLEARFFSQNDRLTEMFPDGACLYGEGYGATIQKGGGNYRADVDFVLFDVKCGDWWLQRSDVEDVAVKLAIDAVPIIGYGDLHEMVDRARKGFGSIWGDFPAEGIVARPCIELKARNGGRIITKIKQKDFQP
jgi:hypothetical protein